MGLFLCTEVVLATSCFMWDFGQDSAWKQVCYRFAIPFVLLVGVPVAVALDVLMLPYRWWHS